MAAVEHYFTRTWGGDPAELLDRLGSTLQRAGFNLARNTQWTMRGEKGSSVSLTRMVPALVVEAGVTQNSDGTAMAHVRIADRMPSAMKGVGFDRSLRERFAQIEREIDTALGSVTMPPDRAPRVDPVPPDIPPPQPQPQPQPQPARSAASRSVSADDDGKPDGLVDRAGAALERLGAKAQETTASMLGRGPEPWQKVESVTFWCPPDQAVADAARIQVYAAVAAMIESQPDALPEKLARELAEFVARVRSVLDAAGRADMDRVRCDVEPAQRPILEFLEQQALLREQLPVRTLHSCKDCGQQKVSNPDYVKLKERNRKMQALTGAVGVTFRGAVNPFLLVGPLFRLKKLDPDYVCGRCQGMNADECIATFCPECGNLCIDAVLRRCGKCEHDYRSAVAPIEVWQPVG